MKALYLLLPLALLCLSAAAAAAPAGAADGRVDLGFTPTERAEFLAEMRQMLASIHGVVAGIGSADREGIAAAARRSGNRMARATPPSVRAKLPSEFRDLGGPTHLMFEELALRAETDEMSDLAQLTGEILGQCLACHAAYRAQ